MTLRQFCRTVKHDVLGIKPTLLLVARLIAIHDAISTLVTPTSR